MLPVNGFTAAGAVETVCSQCGWAGTVPLANITLEGIGVASVVGLPCGGCPAVTYHPVTGGCGEAQPALVQLLHLRKRRGNGETWAAARAAVVQAIRDREPERGTWLARVQTLTDLTNLRSLADVQALERREPA